MDSDIEDKYEDAAEVEKAEVDEDIDCEGRDSDWPTSELIPPREQRREGEEEEGRAGEQEGSSKEEKEVDEDGKEREDDEKEEERVEDATTEVSCRFGKTVSLGRIRVSFRGYLANSCINSSRSILK